ncbi:MAG: DUF370 domain-containing protein [Candidatus Omnitrophica bacterium]|nr:DUF370 domain-containing protein [Candidatus Omnitrophota bacterium]
MQPQWLNVGYDNVVMASRVVAIVSSESAPIKQLKETARKEARLIDATHGRRTRTLVITDSNHVVLSSIQPPTLASRLTDS